MKLLARGLVAVVACGVAAPAALAQFDGELQIKAAQDQAEAWLKLVDAGQYDESWRDAATLFQRAVSKEKWREAIQAARGPLGKLVSRKLKTRQYTEALPGAPDGKYVVLTYKTSFENKKSALETITPMVDGTRGWRVSGYYIK